MPDSLQGKGSTISIGTLVAALAALGGYQASGMGSGKAVSAQLAVLETKMAAIEQKLAGVDDKLDKEDVWVRQMFEMKATLRVLDKRIENLEAPKARRR